MLIYSFLQEYLFKQMHFFGWRDCVEVFFFSTVFYYFSLWLKHDNQKNLLSYFYTYCGITLGAYALQLTTISFFMVLASPMVFVLFVVFHQDILQKNFVALKNIKPAHKAPVDWLDTLVRVCLIAINNNKEVLCVIEHSDNLDAFLEKSYPLKTDIDKELLNIVMQSSVFDQRKIIHINTYGRLLGINAAWSTQLDEQWITKEAKELHKWQQDALWVTSKTDALVLKTTPKTGSFVLIVRGKKYEKIKAANIKKFVNNYLAPTDKKGDSTHDLKSEKKSTQQPNA